MTTSAWRPFWKYRFLSLCRVPGKSFEFTSWHVSFLKIWINRARLSALILCTKDDPIQSIVHERQCIIDTTSIHRKAPRQSSSAYAISHSHHADTRSTTDALNACVDRLTRQTVTVSICWIGLCKDVNCNYSKFRSLFVKEHCPLIARLGAEKTRRPQHSGRYLSFLGGFPWFPEFR